MLILIPITLFHLKTVFIRNVTQPKQSNPSENNTHDLSNLEETEYGNINFIKTLHRLKAQEKERENNYRSNINVFLMLRNRKSM